MQQFAAGFLPEKTCKTKIRRLIDKSYIGEVSEWPKELPWKGSVGFISTAGSNTALSVFYCEANDKTSLSIAALGVVCPVFIA